MTFAHNNKRWFRPNRYLTYLITGYGPINSTLCKRGLADSGNCPMCMESEETPDHMIFDCEAYKKERGTEIDFCRNENNKMIQTQEMLAKANELAKKIFMIRRRNGRGESRGSASTWQGRATQEQSSCG